MNDYFNCGTITGSRLWNCDPLYLAPPQNKNMTEFNVGDRVRRVSGGRNEGMDEGCEGTVVRFEEGNLYIKEYGGNNNNHHHDPKYFILVASGNSTIMNLREKFVLAFIKEPNRSFRKAGITNGDDILTEEGSRVFQSWLLHNKYAEEFKKEVVDVILVEEEKK